MDEADLLMQAVEQAVIVPRVNQMQGLPAAALTFAFRRRNPTGIASRRSSSAADRPGITYVTPFPHAIHILIFRSTFDSRISIGLILIYI